MGILPKELILLSLLFPFKKKRGKVKKREDSTKGYIIWFIKT